MTRLTSLAAVAATAATALPACGGEARTDPRVAQVERAINEFGRAVARRDADSACARMTNAARDQLAAPMSPPPWDSCITQVLTSRELLSDEEAAALDDYRVKRVRGTGDRVEVHPDDLERPRALRAGAGERPVVLRRVEGKWLIEDLG